MAEPINLAPVRVHAISVTVQPPPNSIVGPAEMLLQQGENGGVQIDVFWRDAMGNEVHESKEMQEKEYEALRASYLHSEQASLPPFSSFKSGNTIGRVVGETAPAAVPASQANPPIEAETEEEGITGEQILDGIQLGLDVVGLIPVVGEVADIASGVISLFRGDYVGAGLSLLSAIPFVGYAGTAGKVTRYGTKMAEASAKAGKETAEKGVKRAQRDGPEKNKVRRQRPDPRCGKVSTYRKAPKEKGLLNADHIPSGAALKMYAERRLKEQGIWSSLDSQEQRKILNRVYDNAPTITIPEDVHKEGRTYGNRNKPLFREDGKSKESLSAAFERDSKQIQKSMDAKDHGCTEAFAKAVEELRGYDYDKFIDSIIKTSKYVD